MQYTVISITVETDLSVSKRSTLLSLNRHVFRGITQTGNFNLYGRYLNLNPRVFPLYMSYVFDLAAPRDMPCWLYFAKKYFSYSLYLLGQISRTLSLDRRERRGG